MAEALFQAHPKTGKAVLRSEGLQVWYDPPQPATRTNRPPGQDSYFSSPLLLWMPKRLWDIQLTCPHRDCKSREKVGQGQRLAHCGIYRSTRRVVSLRGHYNLAAEYLECCKCSRKVSSWSPALVDQVDLAHRTHFRVILTYKRAFDVEVVRLLRDRGLGNSPSRLYRQLLEQHDEEWLARQCRYLQDMVGFRKMARNLPLPPLPPQRSVPTYQSLLKAYIIDATRRMDQSKALITSVFGEVLKMDSSKKVSCDSQLCFTMAFQVRHRKLT